MLHHSGSSVQGTCSQSSSSLAISSSMGTPSSPLTSRRSAIPSANASWTASSLRPPPQAQHISPALKPPSTSKIPQVDGLATYQVQVSLVESLRSPAVSAHTISGWLGIDPPPQAQHILFAMKNSVSWLPQPDGFKVYHSHPSLPVSTSNPLVSWHTSGAGSSPDAPPPHAQQRFPAIKSSSSNVPQYSKLFFLEYQLQLSPPVSVAVP